MIYNFINNFKFIIIKMQPCLSIFNLYAGSDDIYSEMFYVNSLNGIVSGSFENSNIAYALIQLSFNVQVVSLAQNFTVDLDIGSDTSFLYLRLYF